MTGSETPPVQGFVAIDNEVKPAPCAVVGREKPLPIHGATVAVPYASGSESHFRVTTSNARGSRGKGMLITVRRADGLTDRFLWRHTGAGSLDAKGLKVDGLFGLVRTDAKGAVACAALADGRSLKADGVSLRGKAGKLVEAWRQARKMAPSLRPSRAMLTSSAAANRIMAQTPSAQATASLAGL